MYASSEVVEKRSSQTNLVIYLFAEKFGFTINEVETAIGIKDRQDCAEYLRQILRRKGK